MSEVLKLLVRNSAVASLLIILIFLLRYILKDKLNTKLQYALWLIVAVRLLIPANFQWKIEGKPIMLQPILYQVTQDSEAVQNQRDIASWVSGSSEGYSSGNFNPIKDSQNIIPKAFFSAWLTGAIVTLMVYILRYSAFRKRVMMDIEPHSFMDSTYAEAAEIVGLKHNIPVYASRRIGSPCILGVFKPIIILNDKILLDRRATKFALLHEMFHYKQKDNLILLMGSLICAMYWFNPLVWLAAKAVKEDAELSCDSRLIKKISGSERYSYCLTLLTVAGDSNQMITAMSSGGKKLKKRIDMIIRQPQKITAGVFAAFICLSLGMASFVDINVKAMDILQPSGETAIVEKPADMILLGSIYEVYQLLNILPNPNDNYKINTITINNEDYFKLLCLSYEFSRVDSIGGLDEADIREINKNALYLFSKIPDLKEIRISYIDKQANSIVRNTEAPITFTYQRSYIIEEAGEPVIAPQIDDSFWQSWGGNNVIIVYGHSEILSHMGIEKDEYTRGPEIVDRVFSILGDYKDTWESHNTMMYRFSPNPSYSDWSNFVISVDEFGGLRSHGVILWEEK